MEHDSAVGYIYNIYVCIYFLYIYIYDHTHIYIYIHIIYTYIPYRVLNKAS